MSDIGTNHAVGTPPVLHHDGLIPMRDDKAGEYIRSPAWRIRHDQPNRFSGRPPRLSVCRIGRPHCGKQHCSGAHKANASLGASNSAALILI